MHFNCKRIVIFFILTSILWQPVSAHEDLDLGIDSVQLNEDCRARIDLKNYGRNLPESFYHAVRPAYISLEKGGSGEELQSLRALDKNRALAMTGGVLTIYSRNRYIDNPKPLAAKIIIEGEFVDYGAANDYFSKSMDCRKGVGQIEGDKIPDINPDIYVKFARIDPQNCELEIHFGNLSSIALGPGAWQPEIGVILMQLALPSHERQIDISLKTLDPLHQFTIADKDLEYRAPLPKMNAEKWRIGLWQIEGDRDFSNNQIEISIPEVCRAGT